MNRLEIKADFGVDDAGTITGIAWPFGKPDRVNDRILKGAFLGTSLPIPMLAYHDPAQPVGVWESAVETDRGLEVRGKLLIETVEKAREVYSLMQHGAVRALSIGFNIVKATGRKGVDRTISALDLAEISLVTVPMHPGARVTSVKSASDAVRIAEALHRAASAYRT